MKKLVCGILLFSLINSNAAAQIGHGSLKVVIDNAEEYEITLAHVMVYQGDKFIQGATPDKFGLCFIAGLDPGVYETRISHVGFETISKKVTIHSNNIRMLETTMRPKVIELFADDNSGFVIYDRPLIALNPFGGPETWQNCPTYAQDRL